MIPLPQPKLGYSLEKIEIWLTLTAIALSFAFPRLGWGWFSRIERIFQRLARRKGIAVAAVGLSVLVLRLALLPLFPIPLPYVPDDFSFLLAADTFAHGRLSNPTPAMWTHFEGVHITMWPTYMSMYFPGYGLILAAGQILFGNPWFATLCIDALMCAALCWMLQAWLPPGWALLGGFIAVLRIGLFSFWINTIFQGSGLLAALGGALVLGALPRLTKTARIRYGILMAVGMAILALSRPYEGVLLCLPVAAVLLHWAWKGKNLPRRAVLLRRAIVPLALLVASVVWLGYYNYRAFGSPTTLPYAVDRTEYAFAPYFVWQPPRPEPHYRHVLIKRFYEKEFSFYDGLHNFSGPLLWSLGKTEGIALLFAGFLLVPPLIMTRRVLLDRRTRLLVLCASIFWVGVILIESFLLPIYVAVFTSAFYALGLQGMRHLRVWAPRRRPVGIAMVRFLVMFCLVLAGARALSTPLGLQIPDWPAHSQRWSASWMGPNPFGLERAQVQAQLQKIPGKQLAIVRYSPNHDILDLWVYNRADINASKIIWAWDMGSTANRQLLSHYPDRTAWLVEPDTLPPTVIPYSTDSPR